MKTAPLPDEECPLCRTVAGGWFHADADREYRLCANCDLVYVPTRWHPSPEREKERYDQHRNDLADPGYRTFLEKLATPLRERLPPGSRGLDFGCGPTGALASLLEESGFRVTRYDPFYAPDAGALKGPYDFVASAEVAEHFFCPGEEWSRLLRLVRPGGWLGITTGVRDPNLPFGQWWYRRDITHVCFYSRHTFEWIARHNRLHLEFAGDNVVLLRLNFKE